MVYVGKNPNLLNVKGFWKTVYENGNVSEMLELDLPVSEGSEDKWRVSTIGSDNHLDGFEGV